MDLYHLLPSLSSLRSLPGIFSPTLPMTHPHQIGSLFFFDYYCYTHMHIHMYVQIYT